MSGYCDGCGNTLCICPKVYPAGYCQRCGGSIVTSVLPGEPMVKRCSECGAKIRRTDSDQPKEKE